MEEVKKSAGRPSLYKPEYCQQLLDHMTNGLSFEAFAGVIGVTRGTLYNWVEEHEDFAEAKAVALEKARLFWEKLGIDNALNVSESWHMGGSKSKSLNATIWIFNMKNRFGWRDKQHDEVDVVVNNYRQPTLEEVDARIAEIEKNKIWPTKPATS